MDWSWIDTIVGAGVGIVAFAVGQAAGRRRRRKDPYADDPQPVCGCGHHFALHDDQGTCRGATREIEKTSERGVTWVTQSCGCRDVRREVGLDIHPQLAAMDVVRPWVDDEDPVVAETAQWAVSHLKRAWPAAPVGC